MTLINFHPPENSPLDRWESDSCATAREIYAHEDNSVVLLSLFLLIANSSAHDYREDTVESETRTSLY